MLKFRSLEVDSFTIVKHDIVHISKSHITIYSNKNNIEANRFHF